MKTRIKNSFTHLSKIPSFEEINNKLILSKEMSPEEYAYLLQIAIIFFDEYLKSEEIDYLNYSYYLILNYYLRTKDYKPLLNFTVNTGIYPIAEVFLRNSVKIDDILISETLISYNNGQFYEMLKQRECVKNLINSNSRVRAYIAPTSYGKSAFIKSDLPIQLNHYNKIAIIVPKKVLIWETYHNIKSICKRLSIPVLLHDTEYEKQKRFVGVFTQERALRLLSNEEVVFDSLYIDEAHNLFDNDNYRSVFLARLIRLSERKNQDCKITYLSPLIKDIENIKVKKTKNDTTDVQRIDFNIKIPDIFYFDSSSGEIEKYSIYSNEFMKEKVVPYSCWEYIVLNSKDKNLLFLRSPRDIVDCVTQFCNFLPDINCVEIDKVIKTVSKYIDKDYLMVSALKKGVLFLHSKIPDFIKEYLIYCFKTISEIKYIISNSTIFEGINLPLSALFIMNPRGLNEKTLINLCGRINRLNNIFGDNVKLEKLVYPVHFIKSSFSKINDVKAKICLLRNDDKDDVKNPLLEKAKMDEKKEEIVELEDVVISDKEQDFVKKILVENGINSLFTDFNEVCLTIKNNITYFKEHKYEIISLQDILKLMCSIFIDNIKYEYYRDLNLRRLTNQEAKHFYVSYVSNGFYYQNIKSKIFFFKKMFEKDIKTQTPSYVGSSFGEVGFLSKESAPLYVEMWKKTEKQMIDYCIVRSEEEDEFVNYTLGKMIKSLMDLNLINKNNHNLFLYNTTDQETIRLMSMGLTSQVISYFKELNLIKELAAASKIGGQISDGLRVAINQADNLIKFEISKIL